MPQRAHDVSRNVRRVGDEHVEGAPFLAGDRAHQVCEAEGDLIGRKPERVAVFGGQVNGTRFDIGSGAGDMAAALPGKGKRDAARAAADLENAGSAGLVWGRRSGILS